MALFFFLSHFRPSNDSRIELEADQDDRDNRQVRNDVQFDEVIDLFITRQRSSSFFKTLHLYRGFLQDNCGRFQQEAHMSDFHEQCKANRAISVHEGLVIGIIAIKCQGSYTCSRLGRKKWVDILLSL